MRNKVFQSQLHGMAFALHPKQMKALLEFANSDTPRSEHEATLVANDSVAYQKRDNVAVISVDGAMYKKDIGGMCASVASYDKIVSNIDTAEADASIDTILFRVDTNGGSVHGVDEVGERIFTSSKKTVTLYENVGASAGIWAFTSSDKVYATEPTMLGSIGVVVSYMEDGDDENKAVDIVSKNAQNKRCNLNGDCKDKMQSTLDSYEEIFYSRVMRNTGLTAKEIKSVFNDGDMIFAKDAEKANFIESVTTFDKLIKSLNRNKSITLEANPTVSDDNSKQKIQGENMTFDRENLDETEKYFNAMAQNRITLENRNSTIQLELENATSALDDEKKNVLALTAKHEKALAEAENKLNDFKAETETRIQEAMATGATPETVLAMVNADSSEDASKIALDAKQSDGATSQTEEAKQVSAWDGINYKNGGNL